MLNLGLKISPIFQPIRFNYYPLQYTLCFSSSVVQTYKLCAKKCCLWGKFYISTHLFIPHPSLPHFPLLWKSERENEFLVTLAARGNHVTSSTQKSLGSPSFPKIKMQLIMNIFLFILYFSVYLPVK
jgi:hypothetical protein